ncbi:Transmembrane protein 87B [Durusdinium trenchii]|uniref:Transmembrane protein 87B n=1 Tax=Durusdinium trenchii TaxID=1381693 RepID=A0ABP0ICK0_9DINO
MAQVAVIPEEHFDKVGKKLRDPTTGEEGLVYCCTKEMADAGNICNDAGALVFEDGATDVVTWSVMPSVSYADTRIKEEFVVPRKGIYYLAVSYCSEQPSLVTVSGLTRWISPYGYLPGELYGFLPSYFYLSMCYLTTAFVWAYLCSKYWRDLLMVQNWMTAVIAFGLIEVYLRYYDFYHWNLYGSRSKGIMLSSIFFLCLKKTLSRVLVLAVAMGYGVVKPTLGEAMNKIAVLGGAYFVFSCIQITVGNLNHSHSVTLGSYVLVLPVVSLDLVFLAWTFSSLGVIIDSLGVRRQETKMQLYIKFRKMLIACIGSGVLWSVFFTGALATGWTAAHWESFYILEVFWDVLYFVMLIAMLYLWSPNSNSQRFAYDRVKTWDQDDEEYADELEDVEPSKPSTMAAAPSQLQAWSLLIQTSIQRTALMVITNANAEKMRCIAADRPAFAEVCWWFTKSREQYRIAGQLQAVTTNEEDEVLRDLRVRAWKNLSDKAREQFFWPVPRTRLPPDPEVQFESLCGEIPQGGRDKDKDGKILPPPDSFVLLLLWPDQCKYLDLGSNWAQEDVWDQSAQTWTTKRVAP